MTTPKRPRKILSSSKSMSMAYEELKAETPFFQPLKSENMLETKLQLEILDAIYYNATGMTVKQYLKAKDIEIAEKTALISAKDAEIAAKEAAKEAESIGIQRFYLSL
jgi:hypothetical protein